ncbi:MAG: hypothetical protein AB7T49_20860 [Oligoflexales bacterium]
MEQNKKEEQMNALYDLFLTDLLALVKSGKVKASDRAVIRQFLRDHDMASKHPKPSTLEALVDRLPHFGDEDAPPDEY